MYGERAAIAILGPRSGADVDRVSTRAEALGRRLAQAGYATIVLGTRGVAHIAARAARLANGSVAAVLDGGAAEDPSPVELELLRIHADSQVALAFAGLSRVLELADAVMIVGGGLDALAALTQIWAWGLQPQAPYRQVLLVGEGWPEIVRTLADAMQLDAKTRAMVTFAKEPAEAVEALRYYVAPR